MVMTLIFDKRNELQGRPGLHALIVGVSSYPHLPGGAGTPAPESFGMTQLSSAALTAYKIYKWLLERQNDLSVPLASCRLLLSPSPEEVTVEPELRSLVDHCTLAKFLTASAEWRADASSRKDNITFFYFAGHGLERKTGDQVLLMEDFGDGIGGTLRNTVESSNFSNGMAPFSIQRNIARTQLYFVDACRVHPKVFEKYEWMSTSTVWDVEPSVFDDRQAPIFYAAVPGSKAYGLKGDQTIFSKAFLLCLNGGAADLKNEDGEEQWCISIHSHNTALGNSIQELNQTTGVEQYFITNGLRTDVIIRRLDKLPWVDLVLEVEPHEALQVTRVEIKDQNGDLTDGTGNPVELPMPLSPHPYRCKLPGGYYRISAEIVPPNQGFVNYRSKNPFKLTPTNFNCRVKVSP